MCDSIGIEPKPNNGTLRLPLKPIGLHSDEPTSVDDNIPDLPAETSHIDNSPTEPNLTASRVQTNAPVGGASSSDIKSADPIETDIVIDTARPEGIFEMKRLNSVF